MIKLNIRAQFILLSGVVGIILIVVSILGYRAASSNLQESIEHELIATIHIQEKVLDGWIREKSQTAINSANLMGKFFGTDRASIQKLMQLSSDPEIMAVTNCDENGLVISNENDYTGQLEIRNRDWYLRSKSERKLIFTDVYVDVVSGKAVVSAAHPYFDPSGNFLGSVCVDISIDTLNDEIKKLKYRGAGIGMILAQNGKVIVSAEPVSQNFSDEFKSHQSEGFFVTADQNVVAYQKLESTGWIVAISVPHEIVFESMDRLQMAYTILIAVTLLGIIVTILFCLRFAARITNYIANLKDRIENLSRGNFKISEMKIESQDEFGDLARAFNSMTQNVRNLIQKVAKTSEDVAKSSEELNASAHQSADSANYVADTTIKVAEALDNQMQNIIQARENIERINGDINSMLEKSLVITQNTQSMEESARAGDRLMQDAIEKMSSIEQSVSDSARMVEKLGENSKEIGSIVEAISSIAEQTNLLALNAAIEAARAGDAGRGFAVVADEVRKLATSSQEAAEKINARIHGIQVDTEQAVRAMKTGTQNVELGSQAMNDVGAQFAEIIRMLNENKRRIEDVGGTVQEVSSEANRIVQVVEKIDESSRTTADQTQTISASTQEQTASTEEIAASSRTLADIANELQTETSKFKI